MKKSALLLLAIMNGTLGYTAEQKSWLAITESLKWHIPQKTKSLLTTENSQYNWELWGRNMANVNSYAIDRGLSELMKLLIINGVLHVIEGRAPYPNSKENWKKFVLSTVHFGFNKAKLAKIQIVKAIFEGMKKGLFGSSITALEDDLRVLMIGTLASNWKTGCLSAGLYEILRSLFQHIHLNTLIEKISKKFTQYEYWANNILKYSAMSVGDLISVYFENRIFKNDESLLSAIYQPFAKEWEVYTMASSVIFGILFAISARNTRNTPEFIARRVSIFLSYWLKNSILVGIKKGSLHSASRFMLSEYLYHLIRLLRNSSGPDNYERFLKNVVTTNSRQV